MTASLECKTYTAACRRIGDWWAIAVPELKGVHSQARRLEQVEDMAREAIALMLDVDVEQVRVSVQPELPDVVVAAIQARKSASEADAAADMATRTAATELTKAGYTVRDIGRMLDLSPQRISQIVGPRPVTRRRGVPKRG